MLGIKLTRVDCTVYIIILNLTKVNENDNVTRSRYILSIFKIYFTTNKLKFKCGDVADYLCNSLLPSGDKLRGSLEIDNGTIVWIARRLIVDPIFTATLRGLPRQSPDIRR